ncbi:DUF1127 domain-containing protein [Sulfitobacter sp. S190]|uniref:DUF1127 domain-containing protein n=1 Tax=Sulfitobacter sp. S190 TaxID=2867022 RepID=UPI0021A522FE|nr:DUF1127 domain-containing protein [Sulfitobacter sp. S190]UWR23373.1 DUF1127 domain-containing protein [Sulfitobacter sp. S190]
MAAFDTTRTTYGVASFASRFVAFVADKAAALIAWNEARITRDVLASLTDRELSDIGLERGDIDAIARSTFIR